MAAVGVTQVTQAWLQSTWQIQVPHTWLNACVDWVLEEADGMSLPQSHLNQQVLDQWLLTDLRDLAHPVLPAGISEAQKLELNGCYCLQVDSLLDVSQPAYAQLQRVRGTDCSNEQVTAVTQATQKPWEAKPTRMLMLQLTDGVQNVEGMEYRPVPALCVDLPPGTKLQVVGRVTVRLGVLLLKPENVRVLGGEVDQLVERYSQGKVLCGTLGLSEENHLLGAEPDDQEVLAGAEVVLEPHLRERTEGTVDSGYDSNSSTINSQASSRAAPPQGRQSEPSWSSSSCRMNPISRQSSWNVVSVPVEDHIEIPEHFDDMPENFDDIPDDFYNVPEDFDDIPMEELDSIMSPTVPHFLPSHGALYMEKYGKAERQAVIRSDSVRPDQPRANLTFASRDPLSGSNSHHERSSDVTAGAEDTFSSPEPKVARCEPVFSSPQTRAQDSAHDHSNKAKADTAILNYLCVLHAGIWPPPSAQIVRLQAFIVTLIGNLRISGGEWKLGATISDGTGYLDVDLCDTLLAKLIGFSASESKVLRKDPAMRGVVDAGIQNCQKELVDMCCVMIVRVDLTGRGMLLRTDRLTDRECCELQRRVMERRS
ncbi:recQ-mediated genome instability protein 1 [Electrophorus electricus]|uniref:RecQ-mediated genome instability protein 1 n=1 Tax=Electrophorus electricus TaxID=8005 RepID=A0AAY5EFW5_ELEEL|nr:recQ-mediated genome instability protein 1 [Electrophorus electricus]XP_026868010.2 recQ-mediated genome instability protein 1 [Electrophorus electricus]XP_026868011.2 recQ-mediated genome instability protein 1 [Electrophorus electricus]XP_035392090.1 recQ-mediated genome instability protein 1 [Electrophorus electricus]